MPPTAYKTRSPRPLPATPRLHNHKPETTAAMATAGEVTCVDFWANGFGMRARIALRELGVAFHYVEEDLRVRERSELVRRMNPVHRSVPILIHDGRPVCGSVNILEYIDEVWGKKTTGGPRLLPHDPLHRAHARFWADFVDQKVFSTQTKFLKSKGEEKEVAKVELLDQLKHLEEVLGDKTFFAGDEFGFLDAVLIPFSSMFHGYEQHGGFSLETECPNLMRWVRTCKERESVKSILPDEDEMYELHKKWYGIE
ncbi:Glutathione S-transferase U25 [Dichanthelium oligosanthes]|uniref:glutathione transferase n=1 Tax=Dichanthelium oligosanthes TaxID=888268 RepID=A0A1E5VUV0_9POAL|nr:Glutathione S-transferase U25 [Dichanthelium oligosanthes]